MSPLSPSPSCIGTAIWNSRLVNSFPILIHVFSVLIHVFPILIHVFSVLIHVFPILIHVFFFLPLPTLSFSPPCHFTTYIPIHFYLTTPFTAGLRGIQNSIANPSMLG
jgi:hypothetical protein